MAYSTTNLYPEDLNGNLPSNLIVNEPQTLQAPGPNDYYFIIPKAAPFFVDSLKVVLSSSGATLVEGDDYQVGHLFVEAMDSIGRPIAGSISFMKPTIVGQVKLTYRTIGGNWGFNDQDILRELSNKQLNPLIRSWGDIGTLPYSFPPLPHDQKIDTLIGSVQINLSLTRIADILEATAAGTSQSHITNYQNPHRVTATQINLGNVPNYKMATDAEMLNPIRGDTFTNPRGVMLLVNKFAVEPMTTHINQTGNVHKMVPADIGLGNVPNWLPANATQAVDPTNNSTFSTPYTVALMVQKYQNDPRLDQLIIDFNDHITANNPHGITPSIIGTYTSAQIDKKITDVSQGGDAATFNGETPAEWEDKFPAVNDINTILTELTTRYYELNTALTIVDLSDPVTDQVLAQRAAQRIGSVFGSYNAYGLYNTFYDLKVVAAPSVGANFPTEVVADGNHRWSTAEDAGYYIQPDGSIDAWGTKHITVPVGYAKGVGFNPTNAAEFIFASAETLYLYLKDNRLVTINRGAGAVAAGNYTDVEAIYINNGINDPRAFGVVIKATADNVKSGTPIGDSSWVTAANAVVQRAATLGYNFIDLRIGSEHLVVLNGNGDDTVVWIYKINYGSSITLTDITATTNLHDHSMDGTVALSTIKNITQVAGSYGHFLFTRPIPGEGEGNGPQTLTNLYSFGDNSDGQLEITSSSGPFYAVGAGNGYTVTINSMNFPEFWGDSPDNSLIYTGTTLLVPPQP